MTPSPSNTPPSPAAAQVDEARLPQGQCRYILITPGLKGQRCACVTFNHNKCVPGATCDCGHLSCFHIPSTDQPSPGQNQTEIMLLKQRIQLLEGQADWDEHSGMDNMLSRVSQLEEVVDKSREDVQAEIKDSYRNISGAWQLAEQLQKRMVAFEESYRVQNERLERASKELQDIKNRQLELVDSDESLEERIEKLETTETLLLTPREGGRRGSMLDVSSPALRRRSSVSRPSQVLDCAQELGDKPDVVEPATALISGSWTVHVSLLPSRGRPFPFEKDTNAYKRCLSRGLHRMVAVQSRDPQSFVTAVSRAFRSVLQDRPWEPLQAKLCDAEKLQGLPMLRPLETNLVDDGNYTPEFLREHCAVCDGSGRVESLYIALRHDRLSWDFLRQSLVFVEGLDSSWEYDQYLDGTDSKEMSSQTAVMQTPPASDVLAPTSGLKRGASEMSQGGSFGPATTASEGEGSRSKMPRKCLQSGMPEMRRGVGTAQ